MNIIMWGGHDLNMGRSAAGERGGRERGSGGGGGGGVHNIQVTHINYTGVLLSLEKFEKINC
jgi:hypothetical protein